MVPDRQKVRTEIGMDGQCLNYIPPTWRERSGSMVECLTRDRGAASSNLTGVTALWSLSMTHLS